MRTRTILIAILMPLAMACSKKKAGEAGAAAGAEGGAAACKPLVVTVDGQPIPRLGHGIGRFSTEGTETQWQVDLFNYDVTCDAYMNKNGRQVDAAEIDVRAFAGGDGPMGHGVGLESWTQAGAKVALVGDKPAKVDDKLSLCVEETTFKPGVGDFKDKTVVIGGLFEGRYCGEMHW